LSQKKLSLLEASAQILAKAGEPLHYRELTDRILGESLAESGSKTPAASVNAVLAVEIKRHGSESRFVRTKPGVFALRGTDAAATSPPTEASALLQDSDRRVRVPLFPVYSELKLLLPVLKGRSREEVSALFSALRNLRGTPQNPVNWTEPDEWIPERLEGDAQILASVIWKSTRKAVNPRYLSGHWFTARTYGLLTEEADGTLSLTASGHNFASSHLGDTEAAVDEGEGVLKLLSIVAEQGPARPGEFVEDWGDYLRQRSGFGTESTIKDTLRRRLKNMLDRKLVVRSTAQYSVTDEGLQYLDRAGSGDTVEQTVLQQILKLSKQQRTTIRESVREILAAIDPYAFEHLVKRLLEAMDYENVMVTPASNDKGVDVVGDIELGITSVREVIQAKRHKATIQRTVLDALRGSLHRFQAVRGTIITTGRFSKGTSKAAFEPGAAPITLIDGEKLIDLLIEHGLGVHKKSIDILELDEEAFAEIEDQATNGETEY